MAHWLLKTEPSTFSIDDLKTKKVEHWDGVRNYMARNNLMAMEPGEECFFYHSSCDAIGIAGVCKVAKKAYPDHTAFDPGSKYYDPKTSPDKPRWFMPDVRFVRKFKSVILLERLRETPGLEDMLLLRRGQRLSVMPVTDAEWKVVMEFAT